MIFKGTHQLVGRDFVCLLFELASWPSQPAELPDAKAKLATAGIFSKKSLPTAWRVAVYIVWSLEISSGYVTKRHIENSPDLLGLILSKISALG